MPMVWGTLEGVEDARRQGLGIRVAVAVSPGVTVRIRAVVKPQTLIARGLQPVALSQLQVGEFVELGYVSESDRLIAETIYVRPLGPELASSSSKSPKGGGEGAPTE